MKGKFVFADTNDPLYKMLLAQLHEARRRLMAGKRFDMPDFRPTRHYIREMQRFGILPKNIPAAGPIDPYATDRKYWESFDWKPRLETAAIR